MDSGKKGAQRGRDQQARKGALRSAENVRRTLRGHRRFTQESSRGFQQGGGFTRRPRLDFGAEVQRAGRGHGRRDPRSGAAGRQREIAAVPRTGGGFERRYYGWGGGGCAGRSR